METPFTLYLRVSNLALAIDVSLLYQNLIYFTGEMWDPASASLDVFRQSITDLEVSFAAITEHDVCAMHPLRLGMQSPGGETRAGTITEFPRRDAGYFKSVSVGAALTVACEQALFLGKK